jgi:hypothetical protein
MQKAALPITALGARVVQRDQMNAQSKPLFGILEHRRCPQNDIGYRMSTQAMSKPAHALLTGSPTKTGLGNHKT